MYSASKLNKQVTIYSFEALLSQFEISPLFHEFMINLSTPNCVLSFPSNLNPILTGY